MSYLSLLYLSIYFLKAFFKEIKMLLFHIFNTEIIDRSIVSYYLTANVTLFRGILMPCSDGINILHLFGTLGLCRLLAKTLEIFKKFQNFKNFSFHKKIKISKISKKFKIFIKLIVTMHIYIEVYFLKRIKLL